MSSSRAVTLVALSVLAGCASSAAFDAPAPAISDAAAADCAPACPPLTTECLGPGYVLYKWNGRCVAGACAWDEAVGGCGEYFEYFPTHSLDPIPGADPGAGAAQCCPAEPPRREADRGARSPYPSSTRY